ncbi:MAG: orotidine-5'-phosphate decarboxylase [Candidatus Eisenbacteria bacterium]
MAKGETGIILALDFDRLDQAERMVEVTHEQVDVYKIGPILFTRFGPGIVEFAKNTGVKVFLDLKFHDIPNTVRGAVRAATSLGVNMLTIHASGGIDMMRGALEGAEEGSKAFATERPLIIGVTVLTSMAGQGDTLTQVLNLAGDAAKAGIDGVVCSPLEVGRVKEAHGDRLLAVVPGIRLGGDEADDQARVGTPGQAVRDGADFLVVGRSVTGASAPEEALARILKEVEDA